MTLDETDATDRIAHLERLIEDYRQAKRRRLLERAMKLWRRLKAGQQRADLEWSPRRIH